MPEKHSVPEPVVSSDPGKSPFRQRFKLSTVEQSYLNRKSLDVVMQHAQRFVRERLAAATPANDGQQTPMRGHPVFVAQHATATCCRRCLAKWHQIPMGREIREDELQRILAVIRHWLSDQTSTRDQSPRQRRLFPN